MFSILKFSFTSLSKSPSFCLGWNTLPCSDMRMSCEDLEKIILQSSCHSLEDNLQTLYPKHFYNLCILFSPACAAVLCTFSYVCELTHHKTVMKDSNGNFFPPRATIAFSHCEFWSERQKLVIRFTKTGCKFKKKMFNLRSQYFQLFLTYLEFSSICSRRITRLRQSFFSE